jgi:preprotein translocase subunit SecD
MNMSKAKLCITIAILAGMVAALVVEHLAQFRLGEENGSLRDQMAPLQTENERLVSHAAQAETVPTLSSDRLRELLRLRGEVGLLRRQQRELQRALAAPQSRGASVSSQPALSEAAQPNRPAPFQVQLVADEAAGNTEPLTNSISGGAGEILHVQKTPLLDYTAISSATIAPSDPSGGQQINIEFSDVGKELLAALTKENLNKRLAIVLDGHLYLAPVIRDEITDGKARVTGAFTEEEARALAAKISDAVNAK